MTDPGQMGGAEDSYSKADAGQRGGAELSSVVVLEPGKSVPRNPEAAHEMDDTMEIEGSWTAD
jgi:hypothetical protein